MGGKWKRPSRGETAVLLFVLYDYYRITKGKAILKFELPIA